MSCTPTSKAIQSAIDICAAAGGGVVDLPAGRYVTGPLWLKENVELRLEAGATVVLSPNKADWPAGIRAMINAKGVKHIAVTVYLRKILKVVSNRASIFF